MSEFVFACPQCEAELEIDDSLAGQVVECPSCRKGIVVPRYESRCIPQSVTVSLDEGHDIVQMRKFDMPVPAAVLKRDGPDSAGPSDWLLWLKLLLALKRRYVTSCSSCGWFGYVDVAIRHPDTVCPVCGARTSFQCGVESYSKKSNALLKQEKDFLSRKKMHDRFWIENENFESDWRAVHDPVFARRIQRLKEGNDRLYQKLAGVNASRIVKAQHATRASNVAFGNTIGGDWGKVASAISCVEGMGIAAEEKKLGQQVENIQETIERNESIIDRYNAICDEFISDDKNAAKRARLKRVCGFTDESELPDLGENADCGIISRIRRFNALLQSHAKRVWRARIFTVVATIVIGVVLRNVIHENRTRWETLEKDAAQFNATHHVEEEIVPYEGTSVDELESLAKSGDMDAKYRLGVLLLGAESEREAEALTLLEEVARGGREGAWTRLAYYFLGKGLGRRNGDSDLGKARACIKEAMRHHSSRPEKLAVAGYLYAFGHGSKKEVGLGLEMLREAAERGDTFAQMSYGGLCLERNENVYQGVQMLVRASLKTNFVAMAKYARLLDEGKFVSRNKCRSDYWWKMAQKVKPAVPSGEMPKRKESSRTTLARKDGAIDGDGDQHQESAAKTTAARKDARCSACKGKGKVSWRKPCQKCKGSGDIKVEVLCPHCFEDTESCPVCGGRGKFICGECRGRGDASCKRCSGSGFVSDCQRCGGTGCRSYSRTCSICGGRGRYEKNVVCSECPGGFVSVEQDCTVCNGKGRIAVHTKSTPRPEAGTCLTCDGRGTVKEKSTCGKCAGTGELEEGVDCSSCEGKGKFAHKVNCPSCGGRGKLQCASCRGSGKQRCSDCNGSGKETQTRESRGRTVNVRVNCPGCNGRRTSQCWSCSGSGFSGTCGRCDGRGRLTSSTTCQECLGKGKISGKTKCRDCVNGVTEKECDCPSCGGKGKVGK